MSYQHFEWKPNPDRFQGDPDDERTNTILTALFIVACFAVLFFLSGCCTAKQKRIEDLELALAIRPVGGFTHPADGGKK